ncbi:MAG: succinylglutamate desuccinylase/aspartoacylase family protein [Spirochaetales bacterium]|nr:succinylglutamate desuccinylase/aspartoacylase family protein [Spirochaetales bacterium]
MNGTNWNRVASWLVLALLSASCVSRGPESPSAGTPSTGTELSSVGTELKGILIGTQDVRPGPGITSRGWLSDYLPGLENSPGDSPVYVLDSGVPGATALVVAGTHANELAGMTAATLLVEKAVLTRGRLIVIPHLNSSGLSYVDRSNPQPSWIRIDAASGTRFFRYGSRFVYPEHQGQRDPVRYTHPASSVSLAGAEQRNINRAYPGVVDGPLAQRVAAAVMAIIRVEGVDIAVDMHEARPSSKLVWMIVANPKNVDVAVNTIFDLEDKDILMKLDQSSEEFRGLSHREWGDHSDAMAFLIETVNPAQDPDAGPVTDHLRHPLFPLWKRVAVQLEALSGLVVNFNLVSEVGTVEYQGVPVYEDLEARGLEAFF